MVVDGMNVYYLVSVCYWFWVFVNWVWCCVVEEFRFLEWWIWDSIRLLSDR